MIKNVLKRKAEKLVKKLWEEDGLQATRLAHLFAFTIYETDLSECPVKGFLFKNFTNAFTSNFGPQGILINQKLPYKTKKFIIAYLISDYYINHFFEDSVEIAIEIVNEEIAFSENSFYFASCLLIPDKKLRKYSKNELLSLASHLSLCWNVPEWVVERRITEFLKK